MQSARVKGESSSKTTRPNAPIHSLPTTTVQYTRYVLVRILMRAIMCSSRLADPLLICIYGGEHPARSLSLDTRVDTRVRADYM